MSIDDTPTPNRPIYYSQTSLAKLLDVSKTTIQRWKKDGLLPKGKLINGIERYSSHDIDAMIAGQNPQTHTIDTRHILSGVCLDD